MIKVLLSHLSYLSIKHKQKPFVDWILPAIVALTCTICSIVAIAPSRISASTLETLLSDMLSLTQSLPGFYIAALAAIATFNKISMDYVMPKPPPTLYITEGEKSIKIEMTRRRFLCLMFAFLAAQSIFLCIILIFGKFIYIPVSQGIQENYQIAATAIFMFFIFFMFFQIIITTFWGIFYLGYRLHKPED
jgi:phage membrane protein